MTDKVQVYDLPVVTTQKFRVSIPGLGGNVFVTRKQVDRQAHNTACDVDDSRIEYEVTQEVSQDVRLKAIGAVQREICKDLKW